MIEFVTLGPFGTVYKVSDYPDLIIETHDENKCKLNNCAIHNPSDHKMKDWPMNLRLDRMAMIERQCPHGVGHPDPDSVAYLESVLIDGQGFVGVHGCDGCCRDNARPGG